MEVLLVLSWLGISTATSTAQRLARATEISMETRSVAEYLAIVTATCWACLSTAMLMGAKWSVSAKEIGSAFRWEKWTASWTENVTVRVMAWNSANATARDSAFSMDSNSDDDSGGWMERA